MANRPRTPSSRAPIRRISHDGRGQQSSRCATGVSKHERTSLPIRHCLWLARQASSLLSKASIDEPVTWEPPPGWITGIPSPGLDPDSITTSDLHPLIRARLSASAIAARLATTADHVLLAAARNPAPRLPGDPPTARSP
jgi:hypothetical protein